MRRAVLAVLFATLAAPSLAQEQPAIDLVAAFMLGVAPGQMLGVPGSEMAALIEQTGPGAFSGSPENAAKIAFTVTEPSKCVFNIEFAQGGLFFGGIRVDAGKLTSVSYRKLGDRTRTVDYGILLAGKEGIVQLLGPSGELAPAEPNSVLSTSLTPEAMQAAVTAFQAGYCPAAI
jgi:hypothetical protein